MISDIAKILRAVRTTVLRVSKVMTMNTSVSAIAVTVDVHRSVGRVALVLLSLAGLTQAANPIVENISVCDPHIRIYGDRAWLYAGHDEVDSHGKNWAMPFWWVWSSTDLVNWTCECTVRPEDTYIKERGFRGCWGGDAARRNGKYYFYFSKNSTEVGVMVADSPKGPWKDPLGKALIAEGKTPTDARDPTIFTDDDGACYIIFGAFNYQISRLNDDMISLAESPRTILVDRAYSCHGGQGFGKTDDKNYLHKFRGHFYLSWGHFYAMSDHLYGPYTYKRSIMELDRMEPEFRRVEFTDRHGAFFTFHNQQYFICNEANYPGSNDLFRTSILNYVHYRDNGEIEPIYVKRVGVGQYDAATGRIEAENYFAAVGADKRDCPEGGFEMCGLRSGSSLAYPHVMNLRENSPLSFQVSSANAHGGTIEVRANGVAGPLLGTCVVPNTGGWGTYRIMSCTLQNKAGTSDIYLVFTGQGEEYLRLDWLEFK